MTTRDASNGDGRAGAMRIFVQIASYRDPQLVPTLDDMLASAKHAARVRVGVCRQWSPKDRPDGIDRYRRDARFRVVDVPAAASRGACWARSLAQGLFAGEEYTLQVDSHTRFVRHWDEALTSMLHGLAWDGVRKPLLTAYPPPFEVGEPLQGARYDTPLRTVFDGFSPEGIAQLRPEGIDDWRERTRPVPACFLAGGFYFTSGAFCWEVPYDPMLYFAGEEISLAVRAFTSGYDLFHPHRTLVWHYYGRPTMPKHWNDHPGWAAANETSFARVRRLLGMDGAPASDGLGRYGLGAARTLAEYERFAGIAFATRGATVHRTVKGRRPDPAASANHAVP